MPRTRASGWSVTITHPQTDRTIRPEIASEPQFSPSLNSLPEIRIPIPKDAAWLDGQFDADPAMSVHLDGNELPIDTLVDVRDSPAGTVLVGRGGDELTDRVTVEYRTERRHTAAENLISNNTTYATDVVAPGSPTDEGTVVQSVSSTAEMQDTVDLSAGEPLLIENGTIKMAQICYVGGTDDLNNVGATLESDSVEDWEKDDYYQLDALNDLVSFQGTVDYAMPQDQVKAYARLVGSIDEELDGEGNSTPDPTIEVTINNDTVFAPSGDVTFTSPLSWAELDTQSYTGGDFAAGDSFEVTIEITSASPGSDSLDVDCIALVDDRYDDDLNFDNTTSPSTGNLSGPSLYQEFDDVEPSSARSAFQIIGGTLTADYDTTAAANQQIQLSNDDGANWLPDDGTETQTEDIDVDFASFSPSMRARLRLSRYSANGTRDDTPSNGYSTNVISSWEMTAKRRLESSLIDERFDDSIASVLTDIAGSQFAWSYRIDDGTPTVAFVAYEQREASDDPDLSDVSVQKQVETWDEVVINGSNVGVSAEEFQASVTFEPLTESNILPGSETVYDSSGTQFSRGVDYEMDYSDGEIRRIGGGALVAGNTYNVDYRFQVQGTHTISTPVSRALTETIPGVTSARQAEQIGFVLGEVEPKVSTPRYEGNIVIPRVDATFDPLEALQLAEFDLPDAARPLAPRGEPQITPEGIRFPVGSAPRIEAQLADIRGQVQAVSRRS